MFKIGLIGVGSVGSLHKKAIMAHPECELTAICNRTLAKAEKLAEDIDARAYSDYKDMQANEELDAVIVNLPHDLHKDVSIYFLERGINVLVEKPMANTVEECDAMIEAAKKSGAVLAVGHPQRYMNANRALKKIVSEGRLGKLCAIDEIRNVDYFTDRPEWFLTKKHSGGGILMNYGAHSLDKIFYMTGEKVEEVSCVGGNFCTDHDVEAHAQLLFKLSGGVSASLTHIGSVVPSCHETTFYFTGGAAKVRGWDTLLVAKGKNDYEAVDCGRTGNFMDGQMEEFVKMLKGEENEMVTAEYGRDVIAVLEEAYKQL